nr:MAG TPA: hypothetical protein [Caudoviricetes sp.]
MTISEAIERADRLMPNQYDREQKVRWLSELDGQAEREVFARCEAPPEGDFTPYDPETDLEKELRIPAPWDGIYLDWLQAQYSYYNAEFTRYGNAQEKFNNAYLSFTASWLRSHMPKQAAYLRY